MHPPALATSANTFHTVFAPSPRGGLQQMPQPPSCRLNNGDLNARVVQRALRAQARAQPAGISWGSVRVVGKGFHALHPQESGEEEGERAISSKSADLSLISQ